MLVTLCVAVPAPPTAADEIVPFGIRFQANDNGAVAVFGNNLLTCPPSTVCTNVRNGTTTSGSITSNNDHNMVNLDQDGAAFPTFNSSSSQVILPSGSTVLFAGLYWGARREGGTNGSDTNSPIGQMSLRLPGESSYRTITTQRTFGPTTTGDAAYQQFANVTGLVQGAGPGEYWGANVAAGTGRDRYAGWSLVVVYRDPTQPLRNLTVFDGFTDVGVGEAETITIAGFLAPLTGAVDARVGKVAYEGDRGFTGDEAFLNTTRLGTALSSGTNLFNSTNDLDGTSVTTRQPADVNMLGFDLKQLGVPGAIPNGATSATIRMSSTSERYFAGAVTTAIRLYAPDFTTSRKAVTNLSGRDPAAEGDVLEYTLTYNNTGDDPAASSIASDPLPPNTTFVPGSIEILTGPNAGVKTDGAGDDQAEFVATSRTVRVRLGTGASASAGGTIAPGASTSVRFRVVVGPGAPGTTLVNQASLAYVAETIGRPFTYVGNEASIAVAENANLSITKTTTPDPAVAGADVTSTLTVTNAGPNTAVNVVLSDTLSDGVAPISRHTERRHVRHPGPGRELRTRQPRRRRLGDRDGGRSRPALLGHHRLREPGRGQLGHRRPRSCRQHRRHHRRRDPSRRSGCDEGRHSRDRDARTHGLVPDHGDQRRPLRRRRRARDRRARSTPQRRRTYRAMHTERRGDDLVRVRHDGPGRFGLGHDHRRRRSGTARRHDDRQHGHRVVADA